MDTLAFGYILPTTGRIRDFNPLETCAARRTTKTPQDSCPEVFLCYTFLHYATICFIVLKERTLMPRLKSLPFQLRTMDK